MAKFKFLHAGSSINWTGKKVLGLHTGTINLKKGFLETDADGISAGEVLMDMTSITITDIADPKTNAQFKEHLFNNDFFDVEKFPVTTFVVSKSAAVENGIYRVDGQLTIKGITHPEQFLVRLETLAEFIHLSGELRIDRSRYNVRYGSGKFFDNLGDNLIHDEFILQFKLIGQRYE